MVRFLYSLDLLFGNLNLWFPFEIAGEYFPGYNNIIVFSSPKSVLKMEKQAACF